MQTKLSQLIAMVQAGDARGALKLAASWGRRGLGGGADAEAITQGWAALSRPDFYLELGKDPNVLAAAGLDAIKRRYKIA